MAVADQFAGLPLEQLIAQPLIEVAKGQAELCSVYLSYLSRLACKDGNADGETNVLKFKLNRKIVSQDGDSKLQEIEVQAPLLSLVPVPAFVMDEATVNFELEVKEQSMPKSTGDESVESQFSTSFGGCHANIQGQVAAHQENSRQTDNTAKYNIYTRAVQQPSAEGMEKLTSISASVIEPIVPEQGK